MTSKKVLWLLLMVLTLSLTACEDDDEPNSGSYTNEEYEMLTLLNGTWVGESSGTTLTFQSYSKPKEIAGVGQLSAIKQTFHGEVSRFLNGYSGNRYYYAVKTKSKKIEAYGKTENGTYSGTSFTYEYEVISKNEITLKGETFIKQ